MQTAIGELILLLKGDRTYEQLSKDCGGVPTAGRIQQMAKKPQNAFPSPESVRGLSRGLGVTPVVVMDACGQDFELWEKGEVNASALPLPAGSDNLSPSQHSAVVGMVRELVRANEEVATLKSRGGVEDVA